MASCRAGYGHCHGHAYASGPPGSSAPARAPAPSGSGSAPGWVPQHHRDITLGRIDGFLSAGQFADVNIRSELWARVCGECVVLEVYSHPKDLPYPSYDEAVRMEYGPARVGDSFGPSWTTHWFRVRARVPPDWDGLGPLMFRWDSGSEAMLYPSGPTPRQGITDQRNEYVLAETAQGGQELLFYVEMAANGMFGTGTDIQPPDENRFFTLKAAELAIPNVPVTALFHDLRALLGLARELPPGNATGEAALYAANKIINTYRRGDPASVDACRALAAEVLGQRDPGERLQVYAVGHCHIDTAWLWPFSETHRKTARSWSAQLRLAERFPWHVFTASSAQQYEWLLQDYPGLFSEIQAAAGRGSFVPVGGTWVEMDTNLPSGESLVRQFLYGQRFFESYFGERCDVFWLPDTFGYSGQLPQIAAGAGIRYFLTQKLSWNNINAFPHSTFYWAGLDGSRLLTHFPPANTYNAQADAHDILATATGSKDKDRAPAAYMLYGNGDGGGGPTADMCESLARLGGCRGLASVSVVAPGEFFARLEAGARDLLTWRGELYFELHRGTYTSHAANKSDNRAAELLLREAEAAGALAAAVLPAGAYSYPRSELDALWKEVLLYQFHDVLPGSAIGRVYAVTEQRYPAIKAALREIRDSALAALLSAAAAAATATGTTSPAAAAVAEGAASAHSAARLPADDDLLPLGLGEVAGAKLLSVHEGGAASSGGGLAAPAALTAVAWAFNSLAFPRREVVAVPLSVLPPGAAAAARQLSADGGSALVVVAAAPLSLTPIGPHDVSAGCTAAAAAAAAPAAEALQGLSLGAASAARSEGVPSYMGCGHGLARLGEWHAGDPWVGPGGGNDRDGDGGAAAVSISRVGRAALVAMGVAVPLAAAAAVGAGAGPGAGAVRDEVWYVMQNKMVRAIFSDSGRLVSLFDLQWRRELVPDGAAGNVFRMYEDIPLFWDAWDIEVYHLEKGWDAGEGLGPPKIAILEAGPLRCRLGIEMALSATSSLRQTVSMTAVSPRLDFHCEVQWAESRTALKVEFPWLLDAANASYEVQYGAVQRPTHTNTSWDWARFEVCAHKWADLSEPGYGVALLNDCKYGHATQGNVMRLTLLRSPKAPDAHTDVGTHAFRYALLPHALDWAAAGVAAHGWAFNAPLRLMPAPPPPPSLMAGWEPRLRRAAEQGAYDPSHPMFTVSSARPNPLQPASAPACPPAPLSAPPLILDTVKLPEPPLERRGLHTPRGPHAPCHAPCQDTGARGHHAWPASQRHAHPVPPGCAPPPPGAAPATGADAVEYPASFQPVGGAGGCGGTAAAHGAPSGCGGAGGGGAGALSAPAVSALVLRLYEPHGGRGVARVSWPAWLRVQHVVRCNLLEDEEGGADWRPAADGTAVAVLGGAGSSAGGKGGEGLAAPGPVGRHRCAGGSVDVPYGPYKLITLKLYLEQDGC